MKEQVEQLKEQVKQLKDIVEQLARVIDGDYYIGTDDDGSLTLKRAKYF